MQGIRKHKESFFHSRFWIVVLSVICILLAIAVFKMYRKYTHAKEIYNEYTVELSQVQKNKEDLEKNIQALSTERGKEAEIRDRYRVVKKDEQMILIIDDQKKLDNQDQENPETGQKSLLGKLRDFFTQVW